MTPTEQDKELREAIHKCLIDTQEKIDDELDQILDKHNGELGVTWEDPDVVTPDTKAALLNWHNQELERAVIEARIDELRRLSLV